MKMLEYFIDYHLSTSTDTHDLDSIVKNFQKLTSKLQQKKLISELRAMIKNGESTHLWGDLMLKHGELRMHNKEAETFIKELYAQLTDKSVPKDMLQHFLEYYFKPNNTHNLADIIENFKAIESSQDQQQLITDLQAIIQSDDYSSAQEKLKMFAEQEMNFEEAKVFIKDLLDGLK